MFESEEETFLSLGRRRVLVWKGSRSEYLKESGLSLGTR